MGRDKGKRHERLIRLLKAARYMELAQAQKVRRLEADMRALEKARETLLEAFGREVFMEARLAEILRRNLDRTAHRAAQARASRQEGQVLLRARRRRVKQIERLENRAIRGLEAERRKDALLDILERAAAGRKDLR